MHFFIKRYQQQGNIGDNQREAQRNKSSVKSKDGFWVIAFVYVMIGKLRIKQINEIFVWNLIVVT